MATTRDELDRAVDEANIVLGRPRTAKSEGANPPAWYVGHLIAERGTSGWALREITSVSGASRYAIPGCHTQAALVQLVRAFCAGAKAMRREVAA